MRLAYLQPYEEMQQHHQHALELMREFAANPNPINYHLFYEYSLGENTQLVETINRMRSKQELWSDILGIRLTETFFREKEREIIHCEQEFIATVHELTENIDQHMNTHFDIAQELENNPNNAKLIALQLKKASRLLSKDVRNNSQRLQATRARLVHHKQTTMTDMVTRLHNELHLKEFLPLIIKRNRSMGKHIACALMDIDQFSHYNEQHGHHLADSLLRSYAKVLQSLGEGTHAWRISADEFLLTMVINDQREIKTLISDVYKKVASLQFKATKDHAAIGQQPVTMVVDLIKDNFESTLNELTDLLNTNKNQGKLIFSKTLDNT